MDMRAMHELREMLCKEIDKIAQKGELSAGSLETVHKLTDTVKNIDKIMMLEDGGHDGYSERGRRRDSMGRYSRSGDWEARGRFGDRHAYNDGGSSYAGRGGYQDMRGGRGYSRDDGKEKMLHELGEMMEDADEHQRRILERAMQEIRKA